MICPTSALLRFHSRSAPANVIVNISVLAFCRCRAGGPESALQPLSTRRRRDPCPALQCQRPLCSTEIGGRFYPLHAVYSVILRPRIEKSRGFTASLSKSARAIAEVRLGIPGVWSRATRSASLSQRLQDLSQLLLALSVPFAPRLRHHQESSPCPPPYQAPGRSPTRSTTSTHTGVASGIPPASRIRGENDERVRARARARATGSGTSCVPSWLVRRHLRRSRLRDDFQRQLGKRRHLHNLRASADVRRRCSEHSLSAAPGSSKRRISSSHTSKAKSRT